MAEGLWSRFARTLHTSRRFATVSRPPRKGRKAALAQAVIETLEERRLFAALYYDAIAAAGLQAGNGTWSTSAVCWNTQADGSGDRVAWVNGSEAHFAANGSSAVTIAGSVDVGGIVFDGTGYSIGGGNLRLTDAAGSIAANRSATIKASIQGSAGLTKSGVGALTLTGSNRYSGDTTLLGGSLVLNSASGYALPGNLTWAAGSTSVTLQAGEESGQAQIAPGAVLSFQGTGGSQYLNLNGHTLTVAGLDHPAADNRCVVQNNRAGTVGTLIVNNAGDYSYQGYLRDGAGRLALVKRARADCRWGERASPTPASPR